MFVDEQRFGPYVLWHHEHHFEEVEQGVKMVDLVTYALPFGYFGRIAHKINIYQKLNQIFQFRYDRLIELFGER